MNTVEFAELATGATFKHEQALYKKEDFRSAILLRDASGNTPSFRTSHTFYPEFVVEPVDNC